MSIGLSGLIAWLRTAARQLLGRAEPSQGPMTVELATTFPEPGLAPPYDTLFTELRLESQAIVDRALARAGRSVTRQ